jgi:hypothetical protein
MNNNIQVDIAILDFAKAFDKVAHKRLSEKLQYYGIDGSWWSFSVCIGLYITVVCKYSGGGMEIVCDVIDEHQ